MKLQQLRYFEAACRLHSISRAAESLHVSQPSVSIAISLWDTPGDQFTSVFHQ